MSKGYEQDLAGGPAPPASEQKVEPAEVLVWDRFVRIFHWSLVLLFTGSHVTGDDYETVHIWIGYTIAALLAVRIVWGFVGSQHARFSDFVYSPRTIGRFVRDSMRFQAPRYIGHNPVGGVMVLALLGVLIGLCVTGYLMTLDAFWGNQTLEDIHEVLANVSLVLVALHVVGVVVASIEHGENLVRSMFTGRKRAD
jgi:cytochrome b